MPSKNTIKEYVEESFYHAYNRGVAKQTIFHDKQDYSVFLNLLKRYLDITPAKDKQGRPYESLYGRVELLAFCLMPNHLHLLLYQEDGAGMQQLMRGIFTSYTRYYNSRYKRMGPLFQSRYKASRISNEAYLQHISRYVHLNPHDYEAWEFSSLPYYLRYIRSEWLRPARIMDLFDNDIVQYQEFLKDYKEQKQLLDEHKLELAHL